MKRFQKERGAAILGAMVTVTLVAGVAGAAVLQMWKATEIEAAERSRVQAQWLLRGALDWSRLLLRQDAQSSGATDHLAEPWAIPLQETKLSSFIAAQGGVSDASVSTDEAFMAGYIQDNQAKLNLKNMVLDPATKHAAHAQRLFEQLGIANSEFVKLRTGLEQAQAATANSPLMPQTLEDLKWLGLDDKTIATLQQHATLLDRVTRVNANTASATVIWAVSEGLTMAEAQSIVDARKAQYFESTNALKKKVPSAQLDTAYLDVRSNSFSANGFVRMQGLDLGLQSSLSRTGQTVGIDAVGAKSLNK
ncbi:type II secretion system minor pseudopilin GspK (plasmid) [Comamonas aquatica]|nr:type II secretion system minor pseudopilin GspK [Comamonas aquatica]